MSPTAAVCVCRMVADTNEREVSHDKEKSKSLPMKVAVGREQELPGKRVLCQEGAYRARRLLEGSPRLATQADL